MTVPARKSLNFRAFDILHDDAALFGEGGNLRDGAFPVAIGKQNLVDAAACLQGLGHGVASDENVIRQLARLFPMGIHCLLGI